MPRGRDYSDDAPPAEGADGTTERPTITPPDGGDRTPRIIPARGKHYTPGPRGPWPGARPRTAPVRRTTGPSAQTARQISYNAASGPIPIGYGYVKTGVGFILRPKVSGAFIYTAGAVGEGEIDSYVWTKIDGRLASEIGATINSYTGTSGQSVDTMLQGVEAQWTNALANIAYHALKIPIPNATTGDFDVTKIETVWKGRKIYDPRGPTTAWSDNPALIWADLATNTRYGGCIPSADIDWDSVGDAADDCDAVIATGPSAPGDPPTVTRVAGGGSLSLSQNGYRWSYTNVDVDGYESAESPLSVGPSSNGLIVNDGDSVDLSDIDAGPGGTVARRIYRTKKDTLSPLRFVAEIPDNTTTTYTDTLADTALGGYSQPGPYKRYTLDLLVQNVAPWPQWDEAIRAHFACLKIWNNGKWKLIVDKAKSVSGITFTDSGASRTLIGFPLVRVKGARERPELVTVSYIDRFNDYSTGSVSWPDPPAAAPKVEERFDLQGIPGQQALRLAKYLYNLRLRDREYTMRTLQRGALPLPGAIVEVTSQRGPLTAEKMLLLNSEPEGIAWKHQLENYDANVYSDSVDITIPPVVEPPDPYGIPPNVTGLTAPTDTEARIGTVYWTAAVWPNILHYAVVNALTGQLMLWVGPNDSPTTLNPLDLKSAIVTDPDGTRHFSITVYTVSTTLRNSSGANVSWTLSTTAQPRDKTIYNINNGAVYATATGWSTVHGAASGSIVTQGSAAGTLHIDAAEESGVAGDYSIWRAFFEFDLTGVFPSDAVLVGAKLEIYPKVYNPTRDTTIYVVESTANAAPFDTADFDAIGTTSFGSRAFTTSEVNAYYGITLNASGEAAIDLNGMNKFALITDDDFNDDQPDDDSFRHDLAYDSTELVANGVRLVITYTSDIEDQTTPPPGTNIQTFTADGTWIKPPGVQNVHIICTGGGGSGASGGARVAGNSVNPGTAGGGGARVERTMPASELPATVSVTVATATTGPAGGVKAPSGAEVDGSNGAAGGTTSFGTHVYAYGGGGGQAITGSNGRCGGGGGGGLGAGETSADGDSLGGLPTTSLTLDAFGTGGASYQTTTGPLGAEYGGGAGGGSGTGTSFSTKVRGGGRTLFGAGGGGGGTAPNGGGTINNPGAGGAPGAYGGTGSGGAAGSNPGGSGGTGGTREGGGGGAGAYNGSGDSTAGNGGNGGAPGGGGGGGGGAAAPNGNTATGGDGGDGARGEVTVMAW